ncbi:MAG: gamma-glutamyltransferase, partial [Myxococcota bacterium]|nr:gamma-glutamyltransferase [Myxococcota bacterium]
MYKKTILFTLTIFIILGAAPPPEQSQNGMVASDHVQASKAGASILEQGGNAVDAAIATALSAGVLQPAGSGLGGGGFAVYRTKAGSVSALDFRERAPAEASRDMFVEQSSRRGGR